MFESGDVFVLWAVEKDLAYTISLFYVYLFLMKSIHAKHTYTNAFSLLFIHQGEWRPSSIYCRLLYKNKPPVHLFCAGIMDVISLKQICFCPFPLACTCNSMPTYQAYCTRCAQKGAALDTWNIPEAKCSRLPLKIKWTIPNVHPDDLCIKTIQLQWAISDILFIYLSLWPCFNRSHH